MGGPIEVWTDLLEKISDLLDKPQRRLGLMTSTLKFFVNPSAALLNNPLTVAVAGAAGAAAKKAAPPLLKFDQDALGVSRAEAIARNNPGNIRSLSGRGFNTYPTIALGLAAMSRQLLIDQDRHHLSTIRQLISRWAPPSDHNPTGAYIANVAKRTGFNPDQALNLHDPKVLAALERAMIRQEHGIDLSQDQLLAAMGYTPANGVRDRGGGHVKVDVTVRHDGARATLKTASSGGVTARGHVARSMPSVA